MRRVLAKIPWSYYVLVAFRFFFVCGTGYIHPDEFFQSPEISAQDILNLRAYRPWEFTDSSGPLRSIAPIWFNSGFCFWILKIFRVDFRGHALLYAPRILLCTLSFTLDATILVLCKWANIPSTSRVLALASSWVLLVFHCRTFSNTLESLILCWCFYVAFVTPSNSARWDVVFGVLLAFGIFVRFTFSTLCVSVVSYRLCRSYASLEMQRDALCAFIMKASPIILGFLLGVAMMVAIDTHYFREAPQRNFFGSLVLCPWNAFDYNRKSRNLKEHGIHPRFTHCLCNMPLLFGPMLVSGLASALFFGDTTKVKLKSRASTLRIVCAATVATQLAVLSLAPHQEPRFLLPLLLPIVILFGDHAFPGSRHRISTRAVAWIAFNFSLAIFFGFVHQGGIVPSLAHLSWEISRVSQSGTPVAAVVYHQTYMPPWHLLARDASDSLALVDTEAVSDDVTLCDYVAASLKDPRISPCSVGKSLIYAVGPAGDRGVLDGCFRRHNEKTRCFGPHFSGEVPASSVLGVVSGLCVGIYEVSPGDINPACVANFSQ